MGDIQALISLDFKTVFLGVFTLLIGAQAILKLVDFFCTRFGIETKKMRERREDHELIRANAEAIKELAEIHKHDNEISNEHDDKLREDFTEFMDEMKYKIEQIAYDRINDREKSREIRADLAGSIKLMAEDNEKKGAQIDALISSHGSMSENIMSILDKIDEMQRNTNERFAISEEKENQRVQSEIKERIAQSYRYHHTSNKITSMELESLEDLIATYETHGGMNSFVHSVVQKEMYTWELIEQYD